MSFSEQHSIPKDKLWIILLCEWKFDLVLFLQTQHLHYQLLPHGEGHSIFWWFSNYIEFYALYILPAFCCPVHQCSLVLFRAERNENTQNSRESPDSFHGEDNSENVGSHIPEDWGVPDTPPPETALTTTEAPQNHSTPQQPHIHTQAATQNHSTLQQPHIHTQAAPQRYSTNTGGMCMSLSFALHWFFAFLSISSPYIPHLFFSTFATINIFLFALFSPVFSSSVLLSLFCVSFLPPVIVMLTSLFMVYSVPHTTEPEESQNLKLLAMVSIVQLHKCAFLFAHLRITSTQFFNFPVFFSSLLLPPSSSFVYTVFHPAVCSFHDS